MRKQNKVTARDRQPAKSKRRRRHMPGVNDRVRALETLKETLDNGASVALLSDVLALWARYMLAANPSTAAPRLYRALVDVWHDNRNEYGHENMSDTREQGTVCFHASFINRFDELFNEPSVSPRKVWLGDRLRSDQTLTTICAMLKGMRERAENAAVFGETEVDETPTETPDEAAFEPSQSGVVVELSCWIQSHPRTIKNSLFAEKED
jgi:hypothetical protein